MRPSEELRLAELEFVARTQARGAEGWASSFAEDGVQLPPGSDPIVGRTAILERAQTGLFARPVDFRWEPLRAEVSDGDDLGFTYGTWRLKGERGEIAAKGKYMSVWRRDDEGRWVVVADLGHSDP